MEQKDGSNSRGSGNSHRFPVAILWLIALISLFILSSPARADDPGLALLFDGINDFVNLGDTSDAMGNGNWVASKSITLWIKVTGSTPPTNTPTLGELILGNDRPRLFGVNRSIYNGRDRIWAWNADSNGADYVGVDFTPGVWTHIAVVHDAGQLSIFEDGVPAGSIASGSTYIPNGTIDGIIYLGGSGRIDPSLYFDGQIDEVALWSIPLNANDIANIKDSIITSAHPLWSNLSAYYRMSNGAGTFLIDDSAQDHAGSLLGGMSDANWIPSGIWGGGSTSTPTRTQEAPTLTPTSTVSLLTQTATPESATSTPTFTPALPADTDTATPASVFTPTETPVNMTPTQTVTTTPTSTSTPTPASEVTATPTTPAGTLVEVGFWDTPGNPYDIVVRNGLAYLADVSSGLRIIDVTNPAQPVEVGFYDSPGRAYGVDIEGNYAYIADAREGLRVVDISNPSHPISAGFYNTPGYAQDVAVRAGIAYVADQEGGVRIIDVSNPAQPVELSFIPTSDVALSVVISGDYAYIAAYTAGLVIGYVADPRQPVIVSSFGTVRAYGIRTDGQHAYTADGGSGLRVIRVSNPAQPVLVGLSDTPGWARSLRLADGIAYVADWTAGLSVVDVSDPARPTSITRYQTPGFVRDVDVSGAYLFVADYNYGLRVLTWR